MLEAYLKRFKTPEPFTEDAILLLARMSRGIFRRFLRYLILSATEVGRFMIELRSSLEWACRWQIHIASACSGKRFSYVLAARRSLADLGRRETERPRYRLSI
jgi:hypothetical protein